MENQRLKTVARQYGVEVEYRPLPTDQDVARVVSDRVTVLLEAKLRRLDRLVHERMERMMPLARKLGEDNDELATIAMLLDEFYQDSLHAPPDLPPVSVRRPEPKTSGGKRRPRRGRERRPRR
jgi:ATP-dependent RNA helicase DeaD